MTKNKPLTEEEIEELLQLWEQLTPDQKTAVLNFIRSFLQREYWEVLKAPPKYILFSSCDGNSPRNPSIYRSLMPKLFLASSILPRTSSVSDNGISKQYFNWP